METRELRYFVAVAEEQHVGRAAQRLGMAQPPLSRAISQLERRLGAVLFERTPRGVSLTAAGAVLLREGQAALAAVEAAERRTRRAAEAGDGPAGIVFAAKAGASAEVMAKLLDAYAAEPGAVPVEVVLCAPAQQAPMLRDGRADVALLHLPFDDVDGFDTEDLLVEPQVLVLPAGHPLTTRRSVTSAEAADLPGLPRPRWPDVEGTYPPGPGIELRDLTQALQMVALGRASMVLPESVQAHLHDDLAVVPVTDAPTVTTLIAWPPHSRSVGVAGLVATAGRL